MNSIIKNILFLNALLLLTSCSSWFKSEDEINQERSEEYGKEMDVFTELHRNKLKALENDTVDYIYFRYFNAYDLKCYIIVKLNKNKAILYKYSPTFLKVDSLEISNSIIERVKSYQDCKHEDSLKTSNVRMSHSSYEKIQIKCNGKETNILYDYFLNMYIGENEGKMLSSCHNKLISVLNRELFWIEMNEF